MKLRAARRLPRVAFAREYRACGSIEIRVCGSLFPQESATSRFPVAVSPRGKPPAKTTRGDSNRSTSTEKRLVLDDAVVLRAHRDASRPGFPDRPRFRVSLVIPSGWLIDLVSISRRAARLKRAPARSQSRSRHRVRRAARQFSRLNRKRKTGKRKEKGKK